MSHQFAGKMVVISGGGASADPSKLNISRKWNRLRVLATATIFIAALFGGLAPRAAADVSDKKTIVSFSSSVEIPGKALPAGTYIFKLLDSQANRNIVQVFNEDQSKLYATILAIPDYRLTPSDKPVIMFEERPSGSPPAIRAWFYPGDNYGQHFVYPQKRATELAKRTNQNVLSMPNEMAKHIATPSKSASDSSVQAMQKAEVTGTQPSGEKVDLTVVILEEPEK